MLSALILGCLLTLLFTGNAAAGLFAVLFAYRLADLAVSSVEVDERSIRSVSAFREEELSLDSIAGYRLVPGRRGRRLELETRDEQTLSLFAHDDLVAWAEHRFPDLDLEDDRKEFESALASHELGENETERLDTIERARKWSVYLNAGAFLASAWVLFFPLPLKAALGAALLFPIAALLLVKLYRGAVMLVGRDTLPNVFLAFFVPIPALAIRSFLEWSVLSWDAFWVPFAAIAGGAFWGAWSVARVRERSGLAFILAVACPVYGYGSVLSLNHILYRGGMSQYQPTILAKRIDGVRRPAPYLTLEPWGPREGPRDLRVRRDLYEKYEVGDRVTIRYCEGALGIGYYGVR